MTGTTGEQLVKARFPEATIKSFDDVMDAVAALKSNQLDAVITAFPAATNVCKHNPDLRLVPEAVDYENTAIAARKDSPELLAAVNTIIAELRNDGTLGQMEQRWLKTDLTPYEPVDLPVPAGGAVLKIGTSATREPFCFMDARRVVTGFDGELARRIGVRLGRPIEFADMKFSALIPALQSGKVDLIVAGMTDTPERRRSVDFTQPYFRNSQRLIVKAPTGGEPRSQSGARMLRTLDDLKTARLGILLGSVHDTYAMEHFPNAQHMQYKSPSELILAVRSGKIDAAIYTTETLVEILRTDQQLQIFGDTLFSVPIGIGFNQEDDTLRVTFNAFLRSIKADGTFDDMVRRWITQGGSEMQALPHPATSGTLVVGTVSDKGLPFTAVKDGRMIGFDIELSERFAAHIGKELKLVDLEFGSLIAAAATRKIDMIASTLMITEQRQKQIDFSDTYYRLGASMFALKENIEAAPAITLRKLDDVADKAVGVYAGSIHDRFVTRTYPQATVRTYNAWADMLLALKARKLDVAFIDLASANVLLKSNPDVGILTTEALTLPVGYGFNKKNSALREQFNRFLARARSDSTYDVIYRRWFVDDPEKAQMPVIELAPDAPQLVLAVGVGDLPNSAIVNGEHVGFDIEFLKTFAKREGYSLKILTMEFSSLIAAVASGKADVIADGIAITEERQKQVDFSEPYNQLKTAVLALKTNLALYDTVRAGTGSGEPPSEPSFFTRIGNSFYSNIILEDRYLLILDGLRTTGIISVLAILFGTALGGLICYMRMSHRKLLVTPAKVYVAILRGTPVLVVLMIIFYVVFASVDIDPLIVAVFAFGLNFAAYVSEMFRTGIEGVDRGQTEAGIAMGFTRVQTFLHIVLPQASKRILPVYKGELISLVKMTSIVGYIAVQDLTKASDIIRSRTFDAFFPLIMVAVLYFLISWLLMVALDRLERVADPRRKLRGGRR
jgi:polar amino acid transport system substrate-binding protein